MQFDTYQGRFRHGVEAMSRLIYADQLQDLEALRDEVDELQEKLGNLEPHTEALEEWANQARALLGFLNRCPSVIELQTDNPMLSIHRLLEDLKRIRK